MLTDIIISLLVVAVIVLLTIASRYHERIYNQKQMLQWHEDYHSEMVKAMDLLCDNLSEKIQNQGTAVNSMYQDIHRRLCDINSTVDTINLRLNDDHADTLSTFCTVGSDIKKSIESLSDKIDAPAPPPTQPTTRTDIDITEMDDTEADLIDAEIVVARESFRALTGE